jgi:hypothetical protein
MKSAYGPASICVFFLAVVVARYVILCLQLCFRKIAIRWRFGLVPSPMPSILIRFGRIVGNTEAVAALG